MKSIWHRKFLLERNVCLWTLFSLLVHALAFSLYFSLSLSLSLSLPLSFFLTLSLSLFLSLSLSLSLFPLPYLFLTHEMNKRSTAIDHDTNNYQCLSLTLYLFGKSNVRSITTYFCLLSLRIFPSAL